MNDMDSRMWRSGHSNFGARGNMKIDVSVFMYSCIQSLLSAVIDFLTTLSIPAIYLITRHKIDINLLISLSGRKKISVFPK